MGCLWLLLLKPNTGVTKWYEIHRSYNNLSVDFNLILCVYKHCQHGKERHFVSVLSISTYRTPNIFKATHLLLILFLPFRVQATASMSYLINLFSMQSTPLIIIFRLKFIKFPINFSNSSSPTAKRQINMFNSAHNYGISLHWYPRKFSFTNKSIQGVKWISIILDSASWCKYSCMHAWGADSRPLVILWK